MMSAAPAFLPKKLVVQEDKHAAVGGAAVVRCVRRNRVAFTGGARRDA